MIAKAFTHLFHTVKALQNRHKQGGLGFHAKILLQGAPHQDIKGLVIASKLKVCLNRDGIVSLHQGVKEFMQADRDVVGVTVLKIIAL